MACFEGPADFLLFPGASNMMGDEGGKSKAEQGIAESGSRVYDAGKLTSQESEQYLGSFDIGKLLEQIYKYQMGLGQAPESYMSSTDQYLRESGELGNLLYKSTLEEAKDPYAYYQSTLDPQLQQAEDYINRQAQGRGLIRSGIPIEQMGRAGVELAIKEANAKMAAREASLGRTAGLVEYMTGQSQNNLTNLANLYSGQQQSGLNAMGRQAGQAQAAGQYWSYPYQARLGDIYGRQAALYALPGQMLQAAGTATAASSIRYKKNVKLWAKQ